MDIRTGYGFDVHRFAPERELYLCGVQIPADAGLLGHSDADVALHALMDSLLGALALGDIGMHFPDTDPAYKGIDSTELLRYVIGLPEIDVWFNEEGKIRALPLNPFASVLSGISFFGDVILGDVFICAHEGAGKSVGLNDEQEMSLRRLFDTTTRFFKEIQVLRKA